MERRTPIWEPEPGLLGLMGPTSGNDINGVGEQDVRSPSLVMWAHPDTIAHGQIQRRVTADYMADPALRPLMRWRDDHEPVEISPEPQQRSPAVWADDVRTFILEEASHTVELVGAVEVRPEWFFEGRATSHRYVIVLGVEMDFEYLSQAPSSASAAEVARQYNRGTFAAQELADWIRARGYEAEGHGGPGAGRIQMVPAALEAGFGELGKHGSIINRDYGSSFRLACVLTDLPLATDAPDRFGADEFCHRCRLCTDACPPDAIGPDKWLVRGEIKWYVDFDRCLPFFAENKGCAVCVSVCPWSAPGRGALLAAKMSARFDIG